MVKLSLHILKSNIFFWETKNLLPYFAEDIEYLDDCWLIKKCCTHRIYWRNYAFIGAIKLFNSNNWSSKKQALEWIVVFRCIVLRDKATGPQLTNNNNIGMIMIEHFSISLPNTVCPWYRKFILKIYTVFFSYLYHPGDVNWAKNSYSSCCQKKVIRVVRKSLF